MDEKVMGVLLGMWGSFGVGRSKADTQLGLDTFRRREICAGPAFPPSSFYHHTFGDFGEAFKTKRTEQRATPLSRLLPPPIHHWNFYTIS